MDELSEFAKRISDIHKKSNFGQLNIENSRLVIKELNEFLFTTYDGIGTTTHGGEERAYFSDYHRYWEKNCRKLIGVKIDDRQCEKVADILFTIFLKSQSVFTELDGIYTEFELTDEEICFLRFVTANQDYFGPSLKFEDTVKHYKKNRSVLNNLDMMKDEPEMFLNNLGIELSTQKEKRKNYTRNLSKYLSELNCTPYELIKKYDNDVLKFKNDLLHGSGSGSGYGSKKANMFIRDMVASHIWNNVTNFDKIDVASDVNTIKIALRTGIIKTKIPLVTSFLDIFSPQYELVDESNERAWRRVWEIWNDKHPTSCVSSPCLIDYFIYNIVGKQICIEKITEYYCKDCKKIFYRPNSRTRKCEICKSVNIEKKKMLPCLNDCGSEIIKESEYYKKILRDNEKIVCPFNEVCKYETKLLEPPKSISILGVKAGWEQSYSRKGRGGGGPKA